MYMYMCVWCIINLGSWLVVCSHCVDGRFGVSVHTSWSPRRVGHFAGGHSAQVARLRLQLPRLPEAQDEQDTWCGLHCKSMHRHMFSTHPTSETMVSILIKYRINQINIPSEHERSQASKRWLFSIVSSSQCISSGRTQFETLNAHNCNTRRTKQVLVFTTIEYLLPWWGHPIPHRLCAPMCSLRTVIQYYNNTILEYFTNPVIQ